MKRSVLVFALALTAVFYAGLTTGGFLAAQESVNLTTPIVKTATNCALDTVELHVADRRIVAFLVCNNGDTITKQYDAFTTPTGAALLSTLNTSTNTAGNSLIRKVYTRLGLDGIAVGTITGTAQ